MYLHVYYNSSTVNNIIIFVLSNTIIAIIMNYYVIIEQLLIHLCNHNKCVKHLDSYLILISVPEGLYCRVRWTFSPTATSLSNMSTSKLAMFSDGREREGDVCTDESCD